MYIVILNRHKKIDTVSIHNNNAFSPNNYAYHLYCYQKMANFFTSYNNAW